MDTCQSCNENDMWYLKWLLSFCCYYSCCCCSTCAFLSKKELKVSGSRFKGYILHTCILTAYRISLTHYPSLSPKYKCVRVWIRENGKRVRQYVNIKHWKKNKVFRGWVYLLFNNLPTLNVSVFISKHHQGNVNMC